MRTELYFVNDTRHAYVRKCIRVELYGDRAFALHHFSDDRIAACEGGGYDMEGTVLADALAAELADPLSIDGAVGASTVIQEYKAIGVNVYSESDALWALP